MVRNQENLDQAIRLRERGFTLQEIAKVCDVSKSTISKWLAGSDISARVTKQNKRRAGLANVNRLKLINKARNIEREKKYQEAVKEAEVSFKHYRKDPLFIAGLMLYIGEGDNKDRAKIRIANSRTSVHRIYIDFMVAYFGIERSKIRFWVLLYPDLSEGACMKYWSKALKLPYSQFYKNQVIQGKSKKRTLQFGVGNTIIVSTVLKYKLNRWIELAEKDL
jgi:transcriptional regulator with XRE-family HTH domain